MGISTGGPRKPSGLLLKDKTRRYSNLRGNDYVKLNTKILGNL